jgi:hypothetical protein
VPNTIGNVQLPQNFVDLRLQVRITPSQNTQSANYGSGIINVSLNTSALAAANDFTDQSVILMLHQIEYQLHHECTHIDSGQIDSKNYTHNNPYMSGQYKQGL